MFRVGQKVACINDRMNHGGQRPSGYNYPIEGTVYTIRDIFADEFGRELVRLCEVKNGQENTRLGFIEPGFDASHFRPVVSRKTDTGMAILKKLLQPKPERVE